MTLIGILLTLIVATVIHISVMASVPAALGIRPIEVSYGLGPLLFKRGVLRIRGILLGGYVKFLDSRDTQLGPEQLEDAIDRRPMWLHSTAIVLPHLILLAGGSAVYGGNPISVTKTIWTRLFRCAIGPLSTAQDQLASFVSFADSNSRIVVLGWLLALVASLALLPVGSAAGGQLIFNLISGRRSPHPLTDRLNVWTTIIYLLLLASWGIAIVLFVWRSL